MSLRMGSLRTNRALTSKLDLSAGRICYDWISIRTRSALTARKGNSIEQHFFVGSVHAVPTFQATPSLYAMAPSKKPSPTGKARSSSSAEPHIKKVKGENFYRNAKAVARLKMLSGGKAVRDKDGKIIQAAAFQKGEDETKPGRVQPDRRWFGAWVLW